MRNKNVKSKSSLEFSSAGSIRCACCLSSWLWWAGDACGGLFGVASPANNTTSKPENNQTEQSLESPATADAVAQVTSVSQLSDVQPTDWAFQALQSLVERYGCIAGYMTNP